MITPIPPEGLVGAAALREAKELRQLIELVRAALDARLNTGVPPGAARLWPDLEAVYPDRAVVCVDGKYWSYPYTVGADNAVTLGEPQQVVEEYVPVLEAAGDAEGLVWEATLIRAGLSKNNIVYPDMVLREAAGLFDGRPVFAKGDAEHLKGEGKDVNKIAGWIAAPRFVAGAGADAGRLQATLHLVESAPVRATLTDAWRRGKRDLVGLSIDAEGSARAEVREGRRVRVATRINKVNSVDLIVEPGAGGGLVRMVEAAATEESDDMTLKQRMLAAIAAKDPAKAATINIETVSDEALESAYREAVAPAPTPAAPTPESIAETLRMIEARAVARATIAAAMLPAPAKERLQADFAARERFSEADVAAAIKAEREYLARFAEGGRVSLDFPGVTVEDRSQKIGEMLDAFFDPAHADHGRTQSFKECYIEITGDKRVTGRLDQMDRTRLAESLGVFRESLDSSSFANVLGSAITRRMVAEYNAAVEYDAWRRIASTVPVGDFRTQERTRFGGYGDLPAVLEGAPYSPLASPSDEKATYAVSKKGGTEDVTLEMIRNDDAGTIARIPVKLGRAAKRTLAKFVFDFIRTNPTIYDGLALFHATHGNLGAAALDATSLAARRLAMLKQTEAGSTDRLGIGPKSLVVPLDLQEAAVNLFNRNTNNDKTFVQMMTLDIIPVWYWSDTNDWALAADPRDVPTIEVGFLDGNEEPELFVQDSPTVGSMFSNDKLTYKIRHIYGGNVVDYRGLDKSVV